ncbi:unnamed protein product, partial [Laminaria digitata]
IVSLDSKNAQGAYQQRPRPLDRLPAVVGGNGCASSDSGVGASDDIVVVGEEGEKNTHRPRSTDSRPSSGSIIEASISNNSFQPNGDDAATNQMDTLARTSCTNSAEGPPPRFDAIAAAAAAQNHSDNEIATYQKKQEEEVKSEGQDDDADDFKPTVTMNPRAVVRERRQWALRRARRREGPNEANQLELGGWSEDMFCEIRVEGARTGEGVDAKG